MIFSLIFAVAFGLDCNDIVGGRCVTSLNCNPQSAHIVDGRCSGVDKVCCASDERYGREVGARSIDCGQCRACKVCSTQVGRMQHVGLCNYGMCPEKCAQGTECWEEQHGTATPEARAALFGYEFRARNVVERLNELKSLLDEREEAPEEEEGLARSISSDCPQLTISSDPDAMRASGWNLGFTNSESNNPAVLASCPVGYFGWSDHSQVGAMSTTLQGNGEATVEFRNCWKKGTVKLYLGGNLLSSSPANSADFETATFTFTDGQLLEIKDEGANAVVNLKSVTINCATAPAPTNPPNNPPTNPHHNRPTGGCTEGSCGPGMFCWLSKNVCAYYWH